MTVKNLEKRLISLSIIMNLFLMSIVALTNDLKETKTSFAHSYSTGITIGIINWIPTVNAQTMAVFDGRCMTFTVAKSYGDPATRFTVQLSKSSNMASPISATVTLAGTTSINHELKGLTGNTTYYYRVKGDNGARSEWSPIKNVKTPAALTSNDLLKCM